MVVNEFLDDYFFAMFTQFDRSHNVSSIGLNSNLPYKLSIHIAQANIEGTKQKKINQNTTEREGVKKTNNLKSKYS